MNKVFMEPIGIIHTPFTSLSDIPRQSCLAPDVEGTVEIYEQYQDGLMGLEELSYLVLIFHFHKSDGYNLRIVPALGTEKRGVFSTRSPARPNSIGMSIVKLISVSRNALHIRMIDVLDGTPLLDIKPYVLELNPVE